MGQREYGIRHAGISWTEKDQKGHVSMHTIDRPASRSCVSQGPDGWRPLREEMKKTFFWADPDNSSRAFRRPVLRTPRLTANDPIQVEFVKCTNQFCSGLDQGGLWTPSQWAIGI